MDKQVELLHRRLERERLARKDAERIIEEKSRELYIKNQELEQRTIAEQKARREAEILRHALQDFTSRLDPDNVVSHLQEFLQSLIAHDGSAIYIAEEGGLHLHSAYGDAAAAKTAGQVIPPAVLICELEQANSTILLQEGIDAATANRWGIGTATATWLVVPMFAHGHNVGCITVESRKKKAFSPSEINLMRALANEAAIALENARLFREVERLSTIDPLTGLCNRRQFSSAARLEFERAQRYHAPLAAIMMDIDHFKRVNDTYGHAVGDEVLVAVAAACLRGIRRADLHARYGGEEFCFLLPQTDSREACQLAERLRAAVAGLCFTACDRRFEVTASFGVAQRLDTEDSLEYLLQRSDDALYRAKQAGRNCVVLWEP